MTINLNPQNKKMILSIDGGGMRGMITIAMLAELERQTGKACHELFDMVAGTSTGAIIAAGIAVGMSAQQILDIAYKDKLPNAFADRNLLFYLRYLFGGLRHLYELKPFLTAFNPYVGGRQIRDLTRPILFLVTKDVRSSNAVYIVSKGPGLAQVADWPLLGAVAASGAAPIYFPPVADNLIDGGVGVHSNPCLAATIEAMEYIGATEGFVKDNLIHVSIGTGYPPNRIAEGKAKNFWLADWIQYVIGEGLDDAGLQQMFTTRGLYGDKIDFRRYNPLLTRDSVANQLGVAITNRPDPNQLTLDSKSPAEVALMEDIGRAYANKLDWTRSNVMPWDTVGGHPKPDLDRFPVEWSKLPL